MRGPRQLAPWLGRQGASVSRRDSRTSAHPTPGVLPVPPGALGHALESCPISAVAAPIQLGRLKKKDGKTTPSRRRPHKSETPKQREVRLKIQAFNLGHASASAKTGFKFDLLEQHLEEHQPDVLSLTEVNDPTLLREKFDHEESAYHLIEPPELSVGSSLYNPKTSTQYENYPLLVRKESGLETSYLGLAPREEHGEGAEQVKQDERGSSSEAWKNYRPLPLFALTHPEGGSFLFGPVHTSPGTTIAEQTVNYANQLGSVVSEFPTAAEEEEAPPVKPPSLLGGDFYNPGSATGKQKVKQLERQGWQIRRPSRLTNFHRAQKNQEKQAADFFIGSKGFIKARKTRAIYPSFKGAEKYENPAEAWARFPKNQLPGARLTGGKRKKPDEVTASDHAPSETEVGLKNPFLSHEDFVQQSKKALKLARKKSREKVLERKQELGLRLRRKPPERFVPEDTRVKKRTRKRVKR